MLWIAATAVVHEAVLVHKDPEFVAVSEAAQERLPA
jgi:predicted nucleic acid-binding protein